MDPRQREQHILVTGAGTGIGRAIATRLAQEGARVSLLGRRSGPLQETLAHIQGTPGDGLVLSGVDIRDADAVRSAVAQAAAQFGPLRGVVANAGLGGPNEPGPDDRWLDIVETNLHGTYHTVRAAQPHLAEGTTHIIITASILARFGVPHYTAYCASKTGLLGLTRALAVELAPQTRVNAICPGWVSTDMAWQGIDAMAEGMGLTREEALAEAMKPVPMGRMSDPEDVAGTVAWLLSNDARGVTGSHVDINNGAWMG